MAHRLDRLELIVVGLAVVLACMSIVTVIAVVSRRRSVVIRDRSGRPRLVLGTDKAGCPEIVLWGEDKKSWLRLALSDEGIPFLALSDLCGVARFGVSVKEGGPSLTLLDGEGDVRFGVGFSPDGVPSMILRGSDGRGSLDVSFNASGEPYVTLFDTEARQRIGGGMSMAGEPSIVFFGRDGQERVRIGFGPDGEPKVEVVDEAGENGEPPESNKAPENDTPEL